MDKGDLLAWKSKKPYLFIMSTQADVIEFFKNC